MIRRTLLLPALFLFAACSTAPTLPPMPTRDPSATAGPAGPVFEITAKSIAYDVRELSAAAGQSFSIRLRNHDPSTIPHDVDIRLDNGSTVVQDKPTIDGGKETVYEYAGLPAGTYKFICSVHPVQLMTGTLSIK